jgi:hypothetical protein
MSVQFFVSSNMLIFLINFEIRDMISRTAMVFGLFKRNVFVDDDERAEGFAFSGTAVHKVVSPDVILPLRPEPDTRTVIEPQSFARALFGRYFQAFLLPVRSTRL